MPRRARPSRTAVIASLTAGTLTALSLAVAQAQRPVGQDRATEVFRGRAVAAGEVLVAFRRPPDLARVRAEIDADEDEIVGVGRLWRAHSRSRNVSSLLAHLSTHSDVLYAEPNYIVSVVNEPDDPRFVELWGLHNIGQTIGGVPGTAGADIRAVTAWNGALGSRNTVVAVVDTGVDYTHPDLAGNIWSAPASFSVTIGEQTITCAAGAHGFNAITKSCDPFDDHFHGTHVAGTIGAVGNNGSGVAGVNWFASIMGLKFLTANGSGTVSDAIDAIEFAIQARAAFPSGGANVRVLSNSWAGGGFSQALLDAINRANENEMLFVAAAGNSSGNNDAFPTYPASYGASNVVAVAATSNQDALAGFSNYGATSVHLGAPGVQVLSTLPGGTYGYLNGTSMATPHVSGAAALLLSRCSANTAALKSMLVETVDQIPALVGRTITGGRLNLSRAIDACGPTFNSSPIVTLTDPSNDATFPAPASITIRATAFDGDGGVSQVAFYSGTALIGIDPAPPYEVTWSDVMVGHYAVTAVATDNHGATSTSAAANIHVLPGPDSLPFGGTAVPIPGILEAEDFNEGGEGVGYHDLTAGNTGGQYRQTDVDIGATSDAGGGYTLGYMSGGEWLAYWVSSSAAAEYTLDARVASAGQGGTFHVEVDGLDLTGPMVVPSTGGWQSWQTISRAGIPLTAGPHLLRVVIDTNGASGYFGNLNYLRWTIPGVNTPPTVQLTSPLHGASYAAPASVTLTATANDIDGTISQVAFYAGSTLLGTDASSPFTFSWGGVPVGTYHLTAIATDDLGANRTSKIVTVHVVTPPSSTPYGGTAAAIPGLIEAERFDEGGEGIAYHDLTPGNTTGQYRQTDVDISTTLDTGGGYSLSYVAAGEWLKYSVAVTAAGSYTLEARVASSGAGGTFHIEVDGVNVTGSLAVPNTGGWQTWKSVNVSGIPLSAGAHILRVVIDTNGPTGSWGNLNYLRWTPFVPPTPFGGTPALVPGVIEAENFDEGGEGLAYHDLTSGNATGQYRQTDVDISTTLDTGGGYSLSYVTAGEWLRYSISVAATGSYTLEARVASSGTGGKFHIEVDGVNVTGSLSVPNTGGWQTWKSVNAGGIPLTAGAHLLRFVIDTNGATGSWGNLNYLRWTPFVPSTPFGGVPAPVPGLIEAENFDEGGEGLAYHDLTAGNTTGQYRQTDVDISTTLDTGGGYSLSYVAAGEWLRYSVTVNSAGTYALQARVASQTAGGTFHVEVDGINVTGTLTVPATGGWQVWQTITRSGISLSAGSHLLRVVVDSAGTSGYLGNVNYFRWVTE
jgi:subtilisin family serine protease/predicted Rdx family selenoprotein